MFKAVATTCEGFFRENITVSYLELLTAFVVAAAISFFIAYMFTATFSDKKERGFFMAVTYAVLALVTYGVFLPYSEHYAEIPHFSAIDCTFSVLVYPDAISAHFDLLFVYLRLIVLLVLPILLVFAVLRFILSLIYFIRTGLNKVQLETQKGG